MLRGTVAWGVLVLIPSAAWAQCIVPESQCGCDEPTPKAWVARGQVVRKGLATVDAIEIGFDAGTAPFPGQMIGFSDVGYPSAQIGDAVVIESTGEGFTLTDDGGTATCRSTVDVSIPTESWMGLLLDGGCSDELRRQGFYAKPLECHDNRSACGCSQSGGWGLGLLSALFLLRRWHSRSGREADRQR